jgi:hypothetical protein
VHLLVKGNFDLIKMHGTMKKNIAVYCKLWQVEAHDILWLITLGLVRCREISLPIHEVWGRKTQYWGFSSGVAEDSKIGDMKVLDGHIDPWLWRQLHLFKTLWSDYPMMQDHVLKEQNHQQQDASSVRDRNKSVFCTVCPKSNMQ